MKVKVDKELCIGAGNCIASAPDMFELDKDDKAVYLGSVSAPEDKVLKAAKSCPYEAISVESDDGERIYP
jgi:ferredoxin